MGALCAKPLAQPARGGPSPRSAASIDETMRTINAVCKEHGSGYSCKTVSWDDAARGTDGGGLSCWGANITDTYLKARDGSRLFTVRPDNWNEKLGKVSTAEVALVTGNQTPGGRAPLRPIALRDFLRTAGEHGGYAGLPAGTDLTKPDLDTTVSIRFQTTFLPVDEAATNDRATIEFATEAYNYNTRSDDDPRNLLLLCTTQGVAVQQDGAGTKRLYHHAVDEGNTVHRYWLEAEQSTHQVGGAQDETAAEKADAIARGKATAAVIGTRAMGTRFNVLMTIQLPLKQRMVPPRRLGVQAAAVPVPALSVDDKLDLIVEQAQNIEAVCASTMALIQDTEETGAACMESLQSQAMQLSKITKKKGWGVRAPRSKVTTRRAPQQGRANAARVSRGTEVGTWSGLDVKAPQRSDFEHITVTVVIYNTVAGGVPSPADVKAAIDDMEHLYQSCQATGTLADKQFDFMKAELTVPDMENISAKIATQPYAPPPVEVLASDVFPASTSMQQ